MLQDSLLLDEKTVAKTLSVSLATVRRWRYVGGGPPFLKIGALVRYRIEAIDAWLEAKVVAHA
ncbi:MAG: helix-turn-helix domain-containing protein [Acidobacteria bacterium]|nr:helix-turn-helix domain-containing protein [Acidobacteriota bacterium]